MWNCTSRWRQHAGHRHRKAESTGNADLLEAHYGVKPILYAAPNTYRAYVKSFAEDYPIWISNYYYKPYFDWTFWQYTDSGELEGYDGYQTHIDLNVYAGSMDEFRQQFGLQAF